MTTAPLESGEGEMKVCGQTRYRTQGLWLTSQMPYRLRFAAQLHFQMYYAWIPCRYFGKKYKQCCKSCSYLSSFCCTTYIPPPPTPKKKKNIENKIKRNKHSTLDLICKRNFVVCFLVHQTWGSDNTVSHLILLL